MQIRVENSPLDINKNCKTILLCKKICIENEHNFRKYIYSHHRGIFNAQNRLNFLHMHHTDI